MKGPGVARRYGCARLRFISWLPAERHAHSHRPAGAAVYPRRQSAQLAEVRVEGSARPDLIDAC